MWIKIIVLSLVTAVLARNIQYTDEDARRDILTIVNYAFGLKTNSHLDERNVRLQLKQNPRYEDFGSRAKPTQSVNNENNLHKYIESPIEGNVNERLIPPITTTQRTNRPSDKETFRDVSERQLINITEARGSRQDVNRTQGQLVSRNSEQTSDKVTKTIDINNKSSATEDATAKVTKEIKPTPSPQIYFDFTTTNEINSRNKDFKTNKIDSLNNVTLQSVNFGGNRTEVTLQHATTAKSKEMITVRPQSKPTTKKVDDDRWIWDDGASTTTTAAPDVDDRAAFAADKCPTGQVKFGDKCVEED